jgi:hypothetical protein
VTSEAFMDEPMMFVLPVWCSNRKKCTKVFLAGHPRTPRQLIAEVEKAGWTCVRTGTRGKFTCASCTKEQS